MTKGSLGGGRGGGEEEEEERRDAGRIDESERYGG